MRIKNNRHGHIPDSKNQEPSATPSLASPQKGLRVTHSLVDGIFLANIRSVVTLAMATSFRSCGIH